MVPSLPDLSGLTRTATTQKMLFVFKSWAEFSRRAWHTPVPPHARVLGRAAQCSGGQGCWGPLLCLRVRGGGRIPARGACTIPRGSAAAWEGNPRAVRPDSTLFSIPAVALMVNQEFPCVCV